MQIDKLQIELRPRSHAQALDLGFALLRSHAGATYQAFLALWVPIVGVCLVLTAYWPTLAWLWGLLAWWVRPLLERAPLYVLSRQVFGTTVSWREALRAWPRQLGGGFWRLLVWGRIGFASGRALLQPVWQLEMARGSVAAQRLRVIGANGTAVAAFWFGVVCLLLEVVLQLGVLALLSMFIGDGESANPFSFMFDNAVDDRALREMLRLGAYAMGAAVIAPIYTACGFTLYLNRRASLEAWDLEIALRQIRRPAAAKSRSLAAQPLALLLAAVCVLAMGAAPDIMAQASPAGLPDTCDGPRLAPRQRSAPAGPPQEQARKLLDRVYAHPDLRGFECVQTWHVKPDKTPVKKPKLDLPDLNLLASVFKVIMIALALGVVGLLLYRYRDALPSLRRGPEAPRATEVGGLDIRAESLPPDVTTEVRALWAQGQRRAALALLYRATLSRLVTDDGLHLHQGDTEGDCLRAAGAAVHAARLSRARLDVAGAATALWLSGAYADRWPADADLEQRCSDWDRQFGAAGTAA
jgi:hypothetical protein